MINDILNSSIGLEGILDHAFDNHLPEAKELVRNLSPDVKVQELYRGNGFNSQVANSFFFKLNNKNLLQPPCMKRALEDLEEKLKEISDEDIASFLKNDLQPLLDNTQLLNSYLNMMVNG